MKNPAMKCPVGFDLYRSLYQPYLSAPHEKYGRTEISDLALNTPILRYESFDRCSLHSGNALYAECHQVI